MTGPAVPLCGCGDGPPRGQPEHEYTCLICGEPVCASCAHAETHVCPDRLARTVPAHDGATATPKET